MGYQQAQELQERREQISWQKKAAVKGTDIRYVIQRNKHTNCKQKGKISCIKKKKRGFSQYPQLSFSNYHGQDADLLPEDWTLTSTATSRGLDTATLTATSRGLAGVKSN